MDLKFNQLHGFGSMSVLFAAIVVLALSPRFRRKAVTIVFYLIFLGLVGLRIWDVALGQQRVSIFAFCILWALLLIITVLSLSASRLALGTGTAQLASTPISQPAAINQEEEPLLRIRKALVAPLMVLIVPLTINVAVRLLGSGETPRSRFGFGVAAAVAFGLLLPLGLLLSIAYRFKVIPKGSVTSTVGGRSVSGHSWLWVFGLAAYAIGLAAEYHEKGQYAIWTVCFLIMWLVVLSFSRFAEIASALCAVGQGQELSDLGASKPRVLLFVFSWIAFAYIYFELLSSILAW